MRTVRDVVHLPAPSSLVWAVITDTDALAEWNPFMTRLEGSLLPGERLHVRVHPGPRTLEFRPTVVEVVPHALLRWRGRMGIPGLFDGVHTLRLEPEGTGTRVVHEERFSGLLTFFLAKLLDDTQQGFTDMGRALQARISSLQSGPSRLTPPQPSPPPSPSRQTRRVPNPAF